MILRIAQNPDGCFDLRSGWDEITAPPILAKFNFSGPHGDEQAARATDPHHLRHLLSSGWPIGEARKISGTIRAVRVA